MEGDYKIVEFEKYCPTCAFSEGSATSEPCNTCLGVSARIDSRKPEKYQEGGKKKWRTTDHLEDTHLKPQH